MTTTTNNEQKKLNVPNKREQNQSCLDSAEREGLRPNGNVPNLRFPEFRGEWEKVRLGEECNMLCGYAFNGEDIVEQGSYLLMRGINITEGSIRHSSELDRYYSGSIEKLDKYKLAIGDLVIGMDGSKVGRNSAIVSSYEDGSYLVQRVCRIRSSIGNNYILQFINNTKFHQYVDTVKTSSAIPHISLRDIKNYRISIPSTQDETDKIAKLFLLLDERIATQNKIIDKLQSLIKGIRNDVFGNLRKNIGFNAVVGDVLDYEQPQSYIVEDTEYTNEGTPVLTANKAFVLGYTSETNGIYDKGDCIIFDDFTLDCKYVDFPFKVKSSAIKILTAKNKELLRYTFEFLKYLDLSTEEHKRHYIAETQNQEIILPTEQMVKTIAHIFSTLSLRMETAVKQRNVFEKQKQYLLRQMFI